MSASLPVYGQYAFEGLSVLIPQLQLIASRHLEDSDFSVYLVQRDKCKRYGLTLEELAHEYASETERLHTLTFIASSPSGRVVRLSVHFFPPPTPHLTRYLIATGTARTNYAIRSILTGEASPPLPTPSVRLPVSEILAPAIRLRADAILLPKGKGYTRPTLNLHDHFYFDPKTSADELIDLLNYLSDRYLGGTSFHLRLETLDGDFHLHLDRRELRYLFERQSAKLLMVYVDALSADKQWMSLRLSYHPLSTGPNAEVSLMAQDADTLLDTLHTQLSISPPDSPLPIGRYGEFGALLWPEHLGYITQACDTLSQHYLERTPAVGFVIEKSGAMYTGLSMYQLEKRYRSRTEEIKRLIITFGRVSTGQVLILWLEKRPQGLRAVVGLLWGADERQQQIWEGIEAHFPEWTVLNPSPQSASTGGPGSMFTLWVPGSERTDKRLALWESAIESAGCMARPFIPTAAHQTWNALISRLQESAGILLDLTYKEPHAVLAAQLAHKLGKRVILAMQHGKVLPPPLVDFPLLSYTGKYPDPQALATQLKGII